MRCGLSSLVQLRLGELTEAGAGLKYGPAIVPATGADPNRRPTSL